MGIYQEVRPCGCHFEITSYNGFQIYPLRLCWKHYFPFYLRKIFRLKWK